MTKSKDEETGSTSRNGYRPEDLNEPELRLYLVEKGRRDGVSGCLRAHREEHHGDSAYWVSTVDGKIRIVRTYGAAAAAAARVSLQKDESALQSLLNAKKGLESAVSEHAHNAEIVAQLYKRLEAVESQVEETEKRIFEAKLVPETTEVEKWVVE